MYIEVFCLQICYFSHVWHNDSVNCYVLVFGETRNSVKGGPQKFSTAVSMQVSVWNVLHYFLSLGLRLFFGVFFKVKYIFRWLNSVINILVLLTWRRTCYLRGADLVPLERQCYALTSKSKKLSIPTQTNRSPVITSVLKKDQENTSSSTHSPEMSHEIFITGFLGRFVQELNFFLRQKFKLISIPCIQSLNFSSVSDPKYMKLYQKHRICRYVN